MSASICLALFEKHCHGGARQAVIPGQRLFHVFFSWISTHLYNMAHSSSVYTYVCTYVCIYMLSSTNKSSNNHVPGFHHGCIIHTSMIWHIHPVYIHKYTPTYVCIYMLPSTHESSNNYVPGFHHGCITHTSMIWHIHLVYIRIYTPPHTKAAIIMSQDFTMDGYGHTYIDKDTHIL